MKLNYKSFCQEKHIKSGCISLLYNTAEVYFEVFHPEEVENHAVGEAELRFQLCWVSRQQTAQVSFFRNVIPAHNHYCANLCGPLNL